MGLNSILLNKKVTHLLLRCPQGKESSVPLFQRKILLKTQILVYFLLRDLIGSWLESGIIPEIHFEKLTCYAVLEQRYTWCVSFFPIHKTVVDNWFLT